MPKAGLLRLRTEDMVNDEWLDNLIRLDQQRRSAVDSGDDRRHAEDGDDLREAFKKLRETEWMTAEPAEVVTEKVLVIPGGACAESDVNSLPEIANYEIVRPLGSGGRGPCTVRSALPTISSG